MTSPGEARRPRTEEERLADHAAIERLAGELLPALAAGLASAGLAEADVREDDWRIRLRLAVDAAPPHRAVPTAERPAMRTEWPAPERPTPERPTPDRAWETDPVAAEVAPGDGFDAGPAEGPVAATSPAVGYVRLRPGIVPGARVRSGDPLGTVDVLGVPHEIAAPADGIVGASFVETGDPVEYGQEIMEIGLDAAAPPADGRGVG